MYFWNFFIWSLFLCVIFVWEIIVGFVFWSFVWIGSGWGVVVLLFDLSFFFIGGVVGFLWWLEILILMYKVIIGINCIIKKYLYKMNKCIVI